MKSRFYFILFFIPLSLVPFLFCLYSVVFCCCFFFSLSILGFLFLLIFLSFYSRFSSLLHSCSFLLLVYVLCSPTSYSPVIHYYPIVPSSLFRIPSNSFSTSPSFSPSSFTYHFLTPLISLLFPIPLHLIPQFLIPFFLRSSIPPFPRSSPRNTDHREHWE